MGTLTAGSTLYKILNSFQERNTTERKVGIGRNAQKLTHQKTKRLVKAATDKNGVSQAKLARKFGIHKSYVQKVFKLRRKGAKATRSKKFLTGLKRKNQGRKDAAEN